MCGTITSVSLCIQLFDAVNGVLGGPASCLGGLAVTGVGGVEVCSP